MRNLGNLSAKRTLYFLGRVLDYWLSVDAAIPWLFLDNYFKRNSSLRRIDFYERYV